MSLKTLLVLIAVGTALVFMVGSTLYWKGRVSRYELALDEALETVQGLQFRQDILKDNASQLRGYMSLPPLNFDLPEAPGEERGNFDLAAYGAIEYLREYKRQEEILALYNAQVESESFQAILAELDLRYEGEGPEGALLRGGQKLVTLRWDDSNMTPLLEGEERYQGFLDAPGVKPFLKEEVARREALSLRLDVLVEELRALQGDQELLALLKERDLSWSDLVRKNLGLRLALKREDGTTFLSLVTQEDLGGVLLDDKSYGSSASLKGAVLKYLEEKEQFIATQQKHDLIEQELLALLEDPAFTYRLSELGYAPMGSRRETEDYIFYDLTKEGGEPLGALGIQKEIGEVYLMDADGVPLRSLRTFLPNHKLIFEYELGLPSEEESLSLGLPEGDETFLLVGSHERNADSIMLLRSDTAQEQLRILSVSRDLYYNGVKLTTLYRIYGPRRLAKALSAITGIDIKRYVAVDMYAFIEIINILGGVEISLEETLIDPTYRVKENGKWSTLFYPPGTYQLNGVAALRVARSRHTSSDFDRSSRQQQIVLALLDKVRSMSVFDLDKVYDIMRVIKTYTKTNMSVIEMAQYALAYGEFSIGRVSVLNTDNILYSSYTNLYLLSEEEQETVLEDENFFKGGWIALPKDDDWEALRRYIQTVLLQA